MTWNLVSTTVLPLTGIHYFFKHPRLWLYFLSIIIPQIILTVAVFFILLTTVSVLQMLLGLAVNGPIGIVIAWANFLHQVDLVSQIVASVLLYPRPLQFLFDNILEIEGFDDVVVRGKYTKLQGPILHYNIFKRWCFDLPGNAIFYPYIIIIIVLNVLLTFVPIIGPFTLVFINSPYRGFSYHKRYYELKGITDLRDQNISYSKQKWDYILFGLSTGVLSQIPFLSTLFLFTNVTGAALWAVELEVEFKRERDGMVHYKHVYD